MQPIRTVGGVPTHGAELRSLRERTGPWFDESEAVSLFETWSPLLEGSISSGGVDWHLGFLLALSAVGAAIVFCLAAAAFRRRKSLPYLLITAALGTLVLRPIVGTGTVLGYVSMEAHHTIEHLLDVMIAGFLLAAIVTVGSLEETTDDDTSSEDDRE